MRRKDMLDFKDGSLKLLDRTATDAVMAPTSKNAGGEMLAGAQETSRLLSTQEMPARPNVLGEVGKQMLLVKANSLSNATALSHSFSIKNELGEKERL